MTTRHQIHCVSKSDRTNAHERITHVGGVSNGVSWKLGLVAAIDGIESGKWAFFVTRGGRTVEVVVAVSRLKHKYLRTVADGEQPDNLLSLPECP